MYLVVLMTILITISVLYGITYLIPNDILDINSDSRTKMDPVLKSTDDDTTPDNSSEDPKEEIKEETSTAKFSDDCYDAITEREGKIYIFKSKRPLEEGSNPKIFSDLPTYRVWGEHTLYEGIRCPILHLDSSTKGYKHPEEKYPQEVPMVNANIIKGQRRKYEATISYHNDSAFSDKPYLTHTPTDVHNYEHDLYKSPKYSRSQKDSEEDFTSSTRAQKNKNRYNSVTDPSRYIAHDDFIRKSQYDGLDLGYDQSLPITPRNFRDINEKEALHKLVTKDPYYKGAVLKRTGTSKYEISEIQPEKTCEDSTDHSLVNTGFTVSKQVPIDLLAYGGTLVPSGSVHGIF